MRNSGSEITIPFRPSSRKSIQCKVSETMQKHFLEWTGLLVFRPPLHEAAEIWVGRVFRLDMILLVSHCGTCRCHDSIPLQAGRLLAGSTSQIVFVSPKQVGSHTILTIEILRIKA